MIATFRRRWTRDEDGATLLEFAFASVIFFMTLFGTIEFGRAVWQYNMMSDLAQEGARWAAVHGSTSLSPASAAQVQTYVQSRSPGFSVTVTTTPAPSTLIAGQAFTVQVQSSFTPSVDLIPHSTMTLTGIANMTVQR